MGHSFYVCVHVLDEKGESAVSVNFRHEEAGCKKCVESASIQYNIIDNTLWIGDSIFYGFKTHDYHQYGRGSILRDDEEGGTKQLMRRLKPYSGMIGDDGIGMNDFERMKSLGIDIVEERDWYSE
ncbi:hypothetical protein QAD02_021000 [Eretmocerus hayati]|uniref:Uncharacterized protein n=1 Tax=Eretmocerus hayati TaxID=131215 RepID=A0ACC2PP77_9HYME|nr:hypothetical protein QAD02_021000 [Eretmocerus hayati]